MAKQYKFVDRAWNVTHKNGKHLGVATVTADSMREQVEHLQRHGDEVNPESIESELLDNSVGNILWNNRVDPEDAEVDEIKSAPRRGTRKGY
jgi:hypothetical protein